MESCYRSRPYDEVDELVKQPISSIGPAERISGRISQSPVPRYVTSLPSDSCVLREAGQDQSRILLSYLHLFESSMKKTMMATWIPEANVVFIRQTSSLTRNFRIIFTWRAHERRKRQRSLLLARRVPQPQVKGPRGRILQLAWFNRPTLSRPSGRRSIGDWKRRPVLQVESQQVEEKWWYSTFVG